MFVVVVFFQAKPAHLETFRAALLANARMSLDAEPGCRQFDVAADPADPASFFLYEIYDDDSAFKAHLETDHFKAFDEQAGPWIETKRVLTYELLAPGVA